MNFPKLFSETREPYFTIQKYLNINLNEKTPFIIFEDQKISSGPTEKLYESAEKAVDQFTLFTHVISYLYSQESLCELNFKEFKSSFNSTSSSSESQHFSQKFDRKKRRSMNLSRFSDEIFDKNIKESPRKTKESPVKTEYDLHSKATLILNIAKNAIMDLAKENDIMELFFRNALANALQCHANFSIKPLCQICLSDKLEKTFFLKKTERFSLEEKFEKKKSSSGFTDRNLK